MRDPMSWSLPVMRVFGIRVRVHMLFLLFLAFELLDASRGGFDSFRFVLIWASILFLSVLLHEFGHCFAARSVGGEAEEILMWPLGGLAYVSVPNTPRNEFITTACGPLVNLAICLGAGVVMLAGGFVPPWNPIGSPFAEHPLAANAGPPPLWVAWAAVVFGINWILFLFNLIPAFPLDGGRVFRCLLWQRIGFSRATYITVQVGQLCAIALGLFALYEKNMLLLGVAVFVYLSSALERRMLEMGMLSDDSVFGYDFSQGYTSLEKTVSKGRPRRPSVWERWRQNRRRLKMRRQQQEQRDRERRVDEILAKLHREGMASLTEQEKRFLTRASAKYRSRNRADD